MGLGRQAATQAGRVTRLLTILALIALFAWLLQGAIDQEHARAGMTAGTLRGGIGGSSEASGSTPVESARLVIGGSRELAAPASGPSSRPSAGIGTSLIVKQATKAESIRAIRLVFGNRAAPAIRVASCETGGTFNAWALGRAGERGLFQIHPIHFSWAQPRRLFDPVWNARVAWRLSRGGTSWRPWACRWAA